MADLFEEKSKNWDASDRRQKLSAGISRCILEHVPLHADMHVMDFGAGTGLITSQLAPFVKKITAVDVSESMLEKLAAKPELRGKVEVLCQDITAQPTGMHYDLIVSAMAMHHVEDTDNMLKQFETHLKPGGQVALADLDAEDGNFHSGGAEGVFHKGFDREEFKALLQKNGFSKIRFLDAYTAQRESGAYPIFLALARKSQPR